MSYKGHIAGCYFLAPVVCHHCRPPVRKYLPQVDVQAHATILSTIARVTLTQKFDVPWKDQGIKKLNYTFPLFDGVSVVGFKCHVKDRVIVGEVKEKEEARQVFKEAVERGEVAGLLEQLPDASDVFTTTVGNIPPNCTVIVEITYLSELRHDAEVDGIRFTIPTTIAPRYGSYPGELAASASTSAASGRFEVVIDTTLDNGSAIRQLSSPTHPISVSLGTLSTATEADPALNKASATLSLGSAEMDKDFVLQIVSKDLGKPVVVLENHPKFPGHRALMATLVPKFQMKPHQPEIVFICDRSGSMQGPNIEALKNALNVLIKSLPVGVLFNICSFGSSYEFLWPKSEPYTQETMQKAVKYVKSFDANFGGTEMYQPINESLKRRFKDRSMELFLVTDGEIWNEQRLFDLLNDRIGVKKEPVRVFTLGIGHDASHSLINGVARAGKGFAQSVGENEKLDAKVVRMLKGALFPHVEDYSLEVKYSSDPNEDDDFEIVEKVSDGLRVEAVIQEAPAEQKPISLFDQSADTDAAPIKAGYEGPKVTVPKYLQAPQAIPPLFPFSRTTVYVLLDPDGPKGTPTSVVLRGTSAQGPLELEIAVCALEAAGESVHQLAAKRAVADLEEGRGWLAEARLPSGERLADKYPSHMKELVRAECVRLGVKFQVGGKHCSFVATETKAADEPMKEDFSFVEEKLEGLALEERKTHTCWVSGQRRHSGRARESSSFGAQPPPPPPAAAALLPRQLGGAPRPARGGGGGGRGGRGAAPRSAMAYADVDEASSSDEDMAFSLPSGSGSRGGGLIPTSAAAPTFATPSRTGSTSTGVYRSLRAAPGMPAPPTFGPPRPMMQQMQMQMAQPMPPAPLGTLDACPQPADFGGFAPTAAAAPRQMLQRIGMGMAGAASHAGATPYGMAAPAAVPPAPPQMMKKRKVLGRHGLMSLRRSSSGGDGVDRDDGEEEEEEEREGGGEAGLQGIIALQTFEGSWEWSAKLLGLIGVGQDALARFGAGVDGKVAATVLAVRFLQARLKAEKDGWEMLVDKATGWLEGQVGAEKMAELFAVAEKVIA